jgi:hypothetical protein
MFSAIDDVDASAGWLADEGLTEEVVVAAGRMAENRADRIGKGGEIFVEIGHVGRDPVRDVVEFGMEV